MCETLMMVMVAPVAILFGYCGLRALAHHLRLLLFGGRAAGTVIGQEEGRGDRRTIYFDIVKYRVGERTFRITGGVEGAAMGRIGRRVTVLYAPLYPERGVIGSPLELFLWPVCLICSGLAGVILSLACYFGILKFG